MISKSIKDYIDSNVGNCDDKLDVAYTIYVLLGKVLFYSPLYAKYKLDNLIPSVDKISLDNPYVNCKTWSELYNQLLLCYGIDSKIVDDKNIHSQVEFNIDDFKVRADATIYRPDDLFDVSSDLTNIKFGLDILYFRLINNKYRDKFNERINKVNKRLNINKGHDTKILNSIKSNIDNNKDMIKYGIKFYNSLYQLSDGEVERRQLFERYYPLLFGNASSAIDFYDDGVLSKHLLLFDENYYLETKNGFININSDELRYLLNNKKIKIKYECEMDMINDKCLNKVI